MKKIIVILLSLSVLFVACGKKEEKIENPSRSFINDKGEREIIVEIQPENFHVEGIETEEDAQRVIEYFKQYQSK